MSTIGGYPARAFSPTQKFLVLDPATQTTSLILGQDLVDYITPSLSQVFSETTRTAAMNEDYQVGQFIQTAGGTAIDDGANGLFLVVEGGTGDYPMLNGNDLLLLPFGSLSGSNLDGALVTDDAVQVEIEDAIALRPIRYPSMEALRLSTTSHDYVETSAFYASGTTGAAKLYRDGTGTPTGSGAAVIAAALAAGTFCNAAGHCYKLRLDQPIRPKMFGAVVDGVSDDSEFRDAWFTFIGANNCIGSFDIGTMLVDSNATLPAGASLFGTQETIIKFADQTAHGIKCVGNHTLIGFKCQGTGIGDGTNGFAFISCVGSGGSYVENVLIRDVYGVDGNGDGVRIEDCKNIKILNTRWLVSRNPITINDTTVGSENIFIDDIYGECKVIGFGAESDDSTLVVQNVTLQNFHFVFTGTAGTNTQYGVGFTKSTTIGAGTFKKYRNCRILHGKVDGFFFAAHLRGADGVVYDDIKAENCTRGLALAEANDVHNADILNCDFDVETNGIVFSGPTKNVTLKNNVLRLDTGFGIFADTQENVDISDNHIIYSDGTGSIGLRVTNCSGTAHDNYIENSRTYGLNCSPATGRTLDVYGNEVRANGVTISDGAIIGSAYAGLKFHDNSFTATGAGTFTQVIEDNSGGKALVENNLGHDLFNGWALTTAASPVTVTWGVRGTDLAYIPIPSGSFAGFAVEVKGLRTGSSTPGGMYADVRGAIQNNGGTTALVGSNTNVHYAETDASMDLSITADNTNDGLAAAITGVASQNHTFSVTARLKYVVT